MECPKVRVAMMPAASLPGQNKEGQLAAVWPGDGWNQQQPQQQKM